ncbi:Clp protease N-terminal domain-containing protein [Antrihabitans sp. YC2-6]|uniref:Clp protease N-terminal domain-containing protein n=1 Tax=Antrihabitans sp. YC2-6 TaxID=2799498 RepID=UPI0018F645C2|nr:Clp protease N-terminal domain-containing protein [Antrihabitans sp. YC2-6]MBJ8347907.1 Clp protease [Antrihabitans sp. YC2-6]
MFEKFSRPARVAVVIAQEEARQLDSPQIGVEHVLLGVLYQPDAPLRALLRDVGLTLDDARAHLRTQRAAEPFGEEDAEALKSIGIDLDAIRASLEASFGENALDREAPGEKRGWFGRVGSGHIPFTREAKKTLELALREALLHKDSRIGSEHVLLGILRAPSPAARTIIEARIPLADLRDRVEQLLDRAA